MLTEELQYEILHTQTQKMEYAGFVVGGLWVFCRKGHSMQK